MVKKMTTKEFIIKARRLHGKKYVYDKVIYIRSSQNVLITCPIHGDFEQQANSHLMGKGCRKCASTKAGDYKRLDTESFVKHAVEVHGGRYGYDKVVYKSSREKVTIKCPEHGDFEQKANSHLQGAGCPNCRHDSKRSDTESFVKHAVEVHGGRYGYDKVVYIGSDKKVTIKCPEHGDFDQKVNNHLGGSGCPKCQKQWSGDGVVYIMCSPEGYNKIGIAKSGTEYKRLQMIFMSSQQRSPSSLSGLKLVCAYSFNDGSFTEARRFEGKAHRHFKARRKQFTEKFDGYAEFFTVPVSEICQYLEQQGGQLVTVVNAP